MGAFTSKATGNWNAAGQTTWNEVGTPGAGDTATIQNTHTVTVTADQAVDGVTTDSGGSLTVAAGIALTGLTASITNNGDITLAAGSSFRYNSASILYCGGLWTVNGTSGSQVTIDNQGAGNVAWQPNSSSLIKWANITGFPASTNLLLGRHEDCEINFDSNRPTAYVGIGFKRCFLYGYTSASRFWMTNPPGPDYEWENIAWGYNRAGSAQTANVMGGGSSLYGTVLWIQNCVSNSSALISSVAGSAAIVDNFGYLDPSMAPGTSSDLDIAMGDAGICKVWNYAGTYERSTSAAKNGTYGVRMTPGANCSSVSPLEVWLYVPCESGDSISVSVYGRRHATSTTTPAQLVIDQEETWLASSVSHEPTMTDADTWYEFTQSGTAAAGSTKGTLRIILRVDEYNAGNYVDFADAVITIGGTTYNFDFQNWSEGMPIPDEPSGGLLTHPGMSGGMRG